MATSPEIKDARARADGQSTADAEFLDEAAARLTEIRAQIFELWAIKVAELRLAFWQKVFGIVAILLGALAAAALVVAAVWFVIAGVAAGLASAFSSAWLGSVVAGILGLAVVGGALVLGRRVLSRRAAGGADGQDHE